jgi:hypothetical protein
MENKKACPKQGIEPLMIYGLEAVGKIQIENITDTCLS